MSGTIGTVLLVASGKGGVGKSTVSVNLALALAEQGQVGLLDADLYGPDIPLMMGLTRRIPAKEITIASRHGFGQLDTEPVDRFGLKVMSTQFLVAEDQAMAWPGPLVDLLLTRLVTSIRWGDLDHLVVDLPPGTADVQQKIVALLPEAAAIVVVTPNDAAHLDAKKVLAMFEKQGTRIAGGIENMSGLHCADCGATVDVFAPADPARTIWAAGVEKLGSIPMDPAIAGVDGRPVMVSAPDGPQAGAFRAIAGRLRALSPDAHST